MKLSEIFEEIEVRPTAFLLLGPPKSGKSQWAEEKIKRTLDIVNLNIENYSDIEIRSDIFESCLDNKDNFIYEGFALKDYRVEKLLNKIKEKGYRVTLVHFNGSLNEDIKNIKKINKKIELIYEKFKDKFDNIIEVNNGHT